MVERKVDREPEDFECWSCHWVGICLWANHLLDLFLSYEMKELDLGTFHF